MSTNERDVELRIVESAELRLAVDDADKYRIRGRATVFNTWTNIGPFDEMMSPSVFLKSTSERAARLPLLALHDHRSLPIGSAVAWETTDDALIGTWEFADTAEARTIADLVRQNHISGLSVGFQPVTSEWSFASPDDPNTRDRVVRKEGRLLETSIVSVPAVETAVILQRTSEGRAKGTPRRDAWRAIVDELRGDDTPVVSFDELLTRDVVDEAVRKHGTDHVIKMLLAAQDAVRNGTFS